jgi:hypothetical protein
MEVEVDEEGLYLDSCTASPLPVSTPPPFSTLPTLHQLVHLRRENLQVLAGRLSSYLAIIISTNNHYH